MTGLAAAGLALALMSASPASAAGGAGTIASAPQMPLVQLVTAGDHQVDNHNISGTSFYTHTNTPGVQFWRVPMQPGSRLTIDYALVAGSAVAICVLQPSVTDLTLSGAHCSASDHTQRQHEFTYTAPSQGSWIVVFADNSCCQVEDWEYSFTTKVQARTVATLHGPSSVRVGKSVRLTGSITGVSVGAAKVQIFSHGWLNLGTAPLSAKGTLSFKVRFQRPVASRFRLLYSGDDQHLPAVSRSLLVRVT